MTTGLKILITNAFIKTWSGSELYVRDLAEELIRRGHAPVVYSPRLGKLADDFRARSIPVVSDLNAVGVKPDLIHGQHHLETMTALYHFPGTPAVYFCHGWLPWEEIPPLHPRILQYVAVSDALHDRLVLECGVPEEKVTTILNFVDLEKFRPRTALPADPKRALVFNNHAIESSPVGMVRLACAHNGITLDTIGYGSGNPSHAIESQLGEYDIVFARGRAALESLAVGAAVICFDMDRMGPMVNTQNLERLRRNNFGIRIMDQPVGIHTLHAEIGCYDPAEAAKASRAIRATSGMREAVDQILAVYCAALDGWTTGCQPDPQQESLAASDYLSKFSDEIYTGRAAQEQAAWLQNELDGMRSRKTWQFYERVARIAPLREFYLQVSALLQRIRVPGKR